MPKAWPEELRERVVKGVKVRKLTIAEAADLYDVGTASVKRWLARFRDTGSVQPAAMGGVRVIWIGIAEKQQLVDLVDAMSDATVEELAAAYNERHGTSVSRSAMSRALLRFDLTRKKKPSAPPKRNRRASPTPERSSRNFSPR